MKRLLILAPLLFTAACLTDDDVDGRNDDITDVDGDGFASTFYGGDDCNDDDSEINPDITETPYDGIDNDCDAETLDDDLDGDGFDLEQDCDDEDSSVNPSADEVCDGVDNNCDDETDEATAVDAPTFYRDNDEDGYVDETVTTTSCDDEVDGYLPEPADGIWDCDDNNTDANPDMEESCLTEFDDDCDGTANVEDSLDCTNFFYDFDDDGFGIASLYSCLCDPDEASSMTSLEGTDCDDADINVNPDAIESIGDEVDSDCDEGDDSFALIPLDTRGAANIYGPRLGVDGDDIALAWIAEYHTGSNGTLYDSRAISIFDGEATSSGEIDFHEFGEATDGGTVDSSWDFAASSTYWGILSAIVDGTTRTTRLETIKQTDLSVGGFNHSQSNQTFYDDLQLSMTASANYYATGCGLDAGSTQFFFNSITNIADGGSGTYLYAAPVTDYVWDYSVTPAAWVLDGYSNGQWDYCELADGDDRFEYYVANRDNMEFDRLGIDEENNLARYLYYQIGDPYVFGDSEFSRTNGQDLMASSYHYYYGGAYYYKLRMDNDKSNYTHTEFLSEIVDVDATNSPGGSSVVCTVQDDGTLSLVHGDLNVVVSPEVVTVETGLATPTEECAVTVTESGILTLAARAGDEIVYGFANID